MQNIIDDMPDSTQMYFQILRCRSEDLCYIPHKSDSVMMNVVKYYQNKNHNAEHFMEARYCLGCIYRDMHQVKESLKYYHLALDFVPKSMNYALIGRIYNQIGHILDIGYSDNSALLSYKKSLYYFKKGKDSRAIPLVEGDLARMYESINTEKAVDYYDDAIQHAITLNDNILIASTMLSKAEFCINNENYIDARRIYNKASDVLPAKYMNQYGFFMLKGSLDNIDKDYKSAIHNFDIASKNSDKARRTDAYLNLRDIYQNGLKNKEKALMYANLSLDLIDSIRLEANDNEVEKIQSLYDYKVEQNRNLQLSVENMQSKFRLQIVAIILLLIILGWIVWLLQVRRKKAQIQKTLVEKDRQYRHSIEYIKENKETINRLKTENDELSVLRLDYLEQNNDKIRNDVNLQNKIWNDFRTSSIYNDIHNILNSGNQQISQREVKELGIKLKESIDVYFDNYGNRIRKYYPAINDTQINICYLLKADFKPSDIAVILLKTKSAITNARNNIRRNCFTVDATLDDVDNFVRNL